MREKGRHPMVEDMEVRFFDRMRCKTPYYCANWYMFVFHHTVLSLLHTSTTLPTARSHAELCAYFEMADLRRIKG